LCFEINGAKTISIAGLKVIMTAKHTIPKSAISDSKINFRARANPASAAQVSDWLMGLQNILIPLTALSFITIGVFYGWNVYGQKEFDQKYRKLESLKQTERQLIVANESLEHDLIMNVDRLPVKLVREKPQQSIFITPAPTLPTPEMPVNSSTKLFDPSGY
jgi:hypothetical protein